MEVQHFQDLSEPCSLNCGAVVQLLRFDLNCLHQLLQDNNYFLELRFEIRLIWIILHLDLFELFGHHYQDHMYVKIALLS